MLAAAACSGTSPTLGCGEASGCGCASVAAETAGSPPVAALLTTTAVDSALATMSCQLGILGGACDTRGDAAASLAERERSSMARVRSTKLMLRCEPGEAFGAGRVLDCCAGTAAVAAATDAVDIALLPPSSLACKGAGGVAGAAADADADAAADAGGLAGLGAAVGACITTWVVGRHWKLRTNKPCRAAHPK